MTAVPGSEGRGEIMVVRGLDLQGLDRGMQCEKSWRFGVLRPAFEPCLLPTPPLPSHPLTSFPSAHHPTSLPCWLLLSTPLSQSTPNPPSFLPSPGFLNL